MHAYQAAALSSGQSFGPFQVVETTPTPWPAPSTPAPQPTATYMNTPLPETPRRTTTLEEAFTSPSNRVMMTPSRIPLPESLMTPSFGNFSYLALHPRPRFSMETPGSA